MRRGGARDEEWGGGVLWGRGGEVKDTCWQLHFLNRCCPPSN